MTASDKNSSDPASVTVRPSKIALQEERETRLAQALRDNLQRRKGQIRSRSQAGQNPGAHQLEDEPED